MLRLLKGSFRRIAGNLRDNPPSIILAPLTLVGTYSTVEQVLEKYGTSAAVIIGFLILGTLTIALISPKEILPSFSSRTTPANSKSSMPATTEKIYDIAIPASTHTAREIIDKCAMLFQDEAIDAEEDIKTFVADKYPLICLKEKSGNNIAFCDYYAFDREMYTYFLEGQASFESIFEKGALPHPAARDAEVLHVATLVHFAFLLDGISQLRLMEVRMVVWAAIKTILTCQNVPARGLDIYSVAWSRVGAAYLKRLGFRPVAKIKAGKTRGKWIYGRLGVTRADLEKLEREYRHNAEAICDLSIARDGLVPETARG